MNKTSDSEFLKSIKRVKRSPKLGLIYEIYRKEQELTLCTDTLNRQNKVWIKHLAPIQDMRIDRMEPLYIQQRIFKTNIYRKEIFNLHIRCKTAYRTIRLFCSL